MICDNCGKDSTDLFLDCVQEYSRLYEFNYEIAKRALAQFEGQSIESIGAGEIYKAMQDEYAKVGFNQDSGSVAKGTRIAELEKDNHALAMHQCIYDDNTGLTNDEYGHSICAKDERIAELEAQVKELVEIGTCPWAAGFEGPETFPDCGDCAYCKAKDR